MQNVELRNQRLEVGGWIVRFWRFSTRHASFGILRPSFCISAFAARHSAASARRRLHSAFYISSRSGQATPKARHCGGQALVESCIVIALICLMLSGFFQLSQLYAAKEISAHACFRGARAKTVGFNDFMVIKSVLVGTIPNAGKMTFPETSGGPLGQMALERGRIPLYLGAEWHMMDGILQYEDWGTIDWSCSDIDLNSFRLSVSQDMPLRFFPAMFSAFYGTNTIRVRTDMEMENHAALYLE